MAGGGSSEQELCFDFDFTRGGMDTPGEDRCQPLVLGVARDRSSPHVGLAAGSGALDTLDEDRSQPVLAGVDDHPHGPQLGLSVHPVGMDTPGEERRGPLVLGVANVRSSPHVGSAAGSGGLDTLDEEQSQPVLAGVTEEPARFGRFSTLVSMTTFTAHNWVTGCQFIPGAWTPRERSSVSISGWRDAWSAARRHSVSTWL